MKAERYRQVDEDYRMHAMAYLNFAASAKKSAGRGKEKPVYTNFRKFYDYERELRKLEGGDKRLRGLGKIVDRQKKEMDLKYGKL